MHKENKMDKETKRELLRVAGQLVVLRAFVPEKAVEWALHINDELDAQLRKRAPRIPSAVDPSLEHALEKANGNKTKAAEFLGISPRTFRRRMQRVGG
jgi:DNA-binding NtrC family response regulator